MKKKKLWRVMIVHDKKERKKEKETFVYVF